MGKLFLGLIIFMIVWMCWPSKHIPAEQRGVVVERSAQKEENGFSLKNWLIEHTPKKQ